MGLRHLLGCGSLVLASCATPPEDAALTDTSELSRVAPATLTYTPRFVLDHVLAYKNKPFDETKPFPTIRFASQTTLTQFQDDIEPQWGMRPNAITNAYVVAKNIVYLMDDAAYYTSHRRCMDDSLAHELTHYVQSKYQGWVLDGMDDSIEMNAIEVQTDFRERFCRPSP